MRRLYAIVISFFVFGIAYSQVIIENSIADLGTIIEAKGNVGTSFYLTGGKDTSEIVDVFTSCGCATVVSKEKTILPGQKIKIDASYDPVGRLGYFSKGIQIVVITKGVQQKLNMILKGRVIRSSKELLKKKVNISLIEVKPIELDFWHQYDTSAFNSIELTNFLNTASYVIDKNNFVTIETNLLVRDSFFLERGKSWFKNLKRTINSKLESRGYKSYQVTYSKSKVGIESQDKMGTQVLMVKDYSKPSFTENRVQFSYRSQGFEEQLVCNGLKGKKFNQFRSEIDSILENRFLILDTVSDIQFITRGTEKELKKMNSFIDKFKKEYGSRVECSVVSEEDSIAHFSFGFGEDKLRIQALEVDLINDLRKKTLVYPTIRFFGDEFKDSKELQLLFDMLRNTRDSLSYKVIYNYTFKNSRKKPSKTSLLKNLALIYSGYEKSLAVNEFYRDGVDPALVEEQVLENKKNEIIVVPYKESDKSSNLIKPYHVIFNSNQFSFDEESYVFKNFMRSLVERIHNKGFVEIIIESSSSNAPTQSDLNSKEIAFKRRDYSIELMRSKLESLGVDPNRLIIKEAKAFVAGPSYESDYFMNKEKYKKFQYLKIIPTSAL